MTKYQVCVVGGCGRAGFPLALVLASRNIRVVIYDHDKNAVETVTKGRIPFVEKGTQELLDHTLNKTLTVTTDPAVIENSETVIFCIGTPSQGHVDPEQSNLLTCIKEVESYLSITQTLIIRSTIFPGMTEYLQHHFKPQGFTFCYCPERISEGNAIQELIELPQIIAAFNEDDYKACEELFRFASKEQIRLPPLEAEFAKLFNNSWRYVKFAVANQFYRMSTNAGADFEQIAHAMRYHYPRARDFPTAGFTGGPCLYKDSEHLNTYNPCPFLQAAIEINQTMPEYIIKHLKRSHDLKTMTIGILGMAYKKDVDDIRNSLSFKLKDLLLKEGAKVLYSDTYWKDENSVNKYQLVNDSDLIIIGCSHEEYEVLDLKGKSVLDLWEIQES